MITIPLPVAKAILKFASSDKTRPSINSIGISQGGLAATDGAAACQFYLDIEPVTASTFDRHWFPRSLVETALKVAKAHKSPFLTLDPANDSRDSIAGRTALFLPLPDIMPLAGAVSVIDAIRIPAQYLALLPLVTKACETEHTSLTVANIDQPVRFDVKGRLVSAVVIINPGKPDFSGE